MSQVKDKTSAERCRSIPEGWFETSLNKLITTNDKSIGKDFKYSNLEYLDTGSITENKIESFQIFNLNEAPSRAKRLVANEDIIYSTVRPNQKHYGFILNPKMNTVVSTGFCVIRTKDNCFSKFLYYWLTQNAVTDYLHQLAEQSASTYPSIKPMDIENLPITLPRRVSEQKAIAKVLSAFDDKIENLRAQNKTLEQTAQTIFTEWFGKYKIGDELPEGWRVGKLGDIVDIFDSLRVPLSKSERESIKGEYRYYGATSVMDYVNDFIFDGIYLLFAEDGSVIDDNGYPFLQYVWGKFWVNNHAHILQGKNGFSTEMLYILCRRMKVAGMITGAVQLKINQGNLLGYELVLPNEDILVKFDKLLQPLFEKLRINNDHIQSLSQTRDTLLPKLMSGQLRVKNLETLQLAEK